MIIGISGKIGSGKTTVAKIVAEKLHLPIRSFGKAVKHETALTYGFNEELCYTQEGKDTVINNLLVLAAFDEPKTVRFLLQYHGTDVRRAKDPEYWVKLVTSASGDCVIDDVRFANEADAVLEKGYLFRIEHYGKCSDPHPSETALDSWQLWDKVFYPIYGELPTVALAIVNFIQKQELHVSR